MVFCLSIAVIWPIAALLTYHMRVCPFFVWFWAGRCMTTRLFVPSLPSIFHPFISKSTASSSWYHFSVNLGSNVTDFVTWQLLLLNITTIEQVSPFSSSYTLFASPLSLCTLLYFYTGKCWLIWSNILFSRYIYAFAYLFFFKDPESSTQNAHPRPTTSKSILAWQLEKESFGCAL